MDPLPFESLFGVQSTRDILYHHCQFLKRCLPSGVLFVRSLHPRRPKGIILFSHTVFNRACGELNPSNFFSKRISISSSVRTVVAFGLFPSPCRLSCFCFAFNASLVFLKSVLPYVQRVKWRSTLAKIPRRDDGSKSFPVLVLAAYANWLK